MKAISPMVATVLLIAFTIGVGALVSIFATSLTTSSTGIASNQSDALTTITSITLIATDGKSTTGSSSLAPGASAATTWTGGTNTSVIARGLCQSTVTVEGKCTNAQSCWSNT
ncbi:MAG: hypothetical protein HYW23_03140 [Candidatus Aenigmarchaeota archaeon]|nr:hypothetical protein [Candidatus Aenigmarchaeota archaeon]